MMKAFVLVLLLSSPAFADETMSKMVFRQEGPDVKPGSFAALPKTLYILGTDKGRVEEAPDPSLHLTGLTIVNGENGWMINLWDKTGRHFIDHDATHNFYSPIVPSAGTNKPPPVRDFQIGHEVEFMKSRHVTAQVKKSDHVLCYECKEEGYTLQTYVSSPAGGGVTESDVLKDGKLLVRLIYSEYSQGLKADPALFQPPPGVTISDS